MRPRILLLLLLLAAVGRAQTPVGHPPTLSIGATLGAPQGEFNKVYGKNLVGLGGNLSLPLLGLPLEMGAAFGWGHLGGERETVAVDQQFLTSQEGSMSTRSNMYSFHLMGRFKPVVGRVSPYVDGLAGFRTFATRTELTVEDVDETLSNERNAHDATWSWGWAAGVMIELSGPLYMEARVENLRGNSAEYIDPTSIEIDADGNVTYRTLSSTTDIFNVHLGIGFTL